MGTKSIHYSAVDLNERHKATSRKESVAFFVVSIRRASRLNKSTGSTLAHSFMGYVSPINYLRECLGVPVSFLLTQKITHT